MEGVNRLSALMARGSEERGWRPRNMFVYLGNACLGKNITELGKILGISQSAASMARKKGREIEVKKRVVEKIIN